MKRFKFKRFFIVIISFLGFFALLFFFAWKLLFFYLKDITEERLSQLFQTETKIKNVKILQWNHWNELQIYVEDLRLKGTPTDSVTQVAYANSVTATLPILDIFFKADTIHIKNFSVDSLYLDFYVDNDRKKNYKLFKPYEPTRKKAPQWVEFHHSYIRACRYHYFFKLHQRDYHFELRNIFPHLVIRKEDLDLQLDLEGAIPYLREKETVFMENASLKFHYAANIKKSKQDNLFKECKIILGGVPIDISGRFYLGWERDYDLKINVLNAHSDSILNLFPKEIQEKIKVYDVQGNLNILGKIVGKWKPEFYVNFWTDSVNITNTITKVGLRNLVLKGNFFNGGEKGKSFAELKVDTLSGIIYNQPFFANFQINDFHQFFLKGHFEMSQNLNVIGKWMGFSDSKNAKGSIDADIHIDGKIKDIAAFDMEKVHLNGYLKAQNLNVPSSWTPFEIQNTYFDLLFNNHEIILQNAKSYLNNQPVEIYGRLSTKAFDLKPQFIAEATIVFDTLSPQNFIQKTLKKNQNIFPTLPNNFFVNLNLKANHIIYKKVELQETCASLALRPHKLQIHEINIKGKEDSLLLHADFFQVHQDTIHFIVNQNITTLSLIDILEELGFSFQKWDSVNIALSNKTQIQGKIFRNSLNEIDGNFDIKIWLDYLKYPKPEITLTNFQANLSTTLTKILKPKENSWLLSHIQGEVNHQPFVGSLGFVPSKNGFLFYPSLNMELCLESLQPFIKPENISDYGGNFVFSYFGQGLLKNFIKPDSSVYQSAHGNVWINELSFLIENKNLPLDSIYGFIQYDDYGLNAHNICGKIGNSDFCVSGFTQNILAYLFLKNTRLEGTMKLLSDTLFIKDFTVENFNKIKEDKVKSFDIKLPNNVNLDIDAQIMNAIFDKLKFQLVMLNACAQNKMAFIDDFNAYFDKGYWKSHLLWDGRDTANQYIYSDLILKNLNVRNFLYDFNNFKQSFIEYQNIEGNLSVEAFLEMTFPSNLKTDFSSLRGKFSFVIENGVLRNFIPFQKLKGLVKKKYLEAPNFTMIAKDIVVENRMLKIPKLEIRSDIAHIVISGTHTFDQDIDYQIQILRIKRRFKEEKKAQAIIYDKTALLFRFKGSRGKYKLTYDFRAFWNRFFKKKNHILTNSF